MSVEVRPTAIVRQPAGPNPLTPEQRYWKTFKSQVLVQSPTGAPIQSVNATKYAAGTPAASADLFAITTGARVQLFSSRTRRLVKTITRFSDTVYNAQIRKDGRVLATGDDTGQIQVFDISSRAILKTWRLHKQPVWRTIWDPADLTNLLSTSDDRTVRLWDLTADDPLITFVGHTDYVRSGAFLEGRAAGLVVSGSYDQTVKIWDTRASERVVMTFRHDAPVEEVLPMASGTTVLSAADNKVTVLDLVAGRPSHSMHNHQKTVTSMTLAGNGSRLLAGALDGHVKIFETENWNVVTGVKYPSAVLSLSVIPSNVGRDDRHLVVGMQDGTLSIRTRLTSEAKARAKERAKEMAALEAGEIERYDAQKAHMDRLTSGWRARFRGRDFTGEGADVVIEGNPQRRKKLSPWQRDLHNGRYGSALNRTIAMGDLGATITTVAALRHRSALRVALEKRDETSLQPILQFLCRYIIDPRYVGLCVEMGILLLDIYAERAGQSRNVDGLWKRLHALVQAETNRAQQAWQTQGMLGLLIET